jgi:peptidoglycan LD-endopeptidase CwlK
MGDRAWSYGVVCLVGGEQMSFQFSQRSLDRLIGVHPDLVRVVQTAISIAKSDFMVIEGIRTLEKQREYFQAGKSLTMKSRHLTGHAVDLAPYVDTDNDGDLLLPNR